MDEELLCPIATTTDCSRDEARGDEYNSKHVQNVSSLAEAQAIAGLPEPYPFTSDIPALVVYLSVPMRRSPLHGMFCGFHVFIAAIPERNAYFERLAFSSWIETWARA